MSRLRTLIGERMHQSSQVTAPVTLSAETDVNEIVEFRNQAKTQPELPIVPSYNAIIMKAVGLALMEHPQLNCSIEGDELVFWEAVNIGIAIDTPRGLLVPVVRDVTGRTITELSQEIDSLIQAASQNRLLPDQFQGGTFTITNLGMLDVDFFTPIINYPEVAVLGIGRMKNVLERRSGALVERAKAYLSLTFDHRAVDGAPAAAFLRDIKLMIEQPGNWLRHDGQSGGGDLA
jgi:pyruvate dehydrogenase E2 component (dihydrolipoamide acetyltransferase)